MMTAFAIKKGGELQSLESPEAVSRVWNEEGMRVWVDLEAPDEATLQTLNTLIDIDPDSLEDCLSGEQHPRIDEYEHYIFLVLYGARGVEDEPKFRPRKLAVICGPHFLVTLHAEPLQTIRRARKRLKRNGGTLLLDGVDHLLYVIIDNMVDNYENVVAKYEAQLEDLEDVSLSQKVDPKLLERLGDVRRDVLNLRRLTRSQRELLQPLAQGECDYISAHLSIRFRHVRDHLTRVLERTEIVREMLHTVRDNYDSMIANRMNAIMRQLTMFSTILLPLSLLAGIFGMNVKFWPPPDTRHSFYFIMAVMITVALILYLYFRRKKWI